MYNRYKVPVRGFLVLLLAVLIIFYLVSGICNVPDVNILNIREALAYSFTHPLEAWNDKTPVFLCVGFLIWGYFVVYYLDMHRNTHSDMYGSSKWREVHEANEQYCDKENPKNNIRLTQNLSVSPSRLANGNMLFLASSGDGKTTSIVGHILESLANSYVVLDLKGDLIKKWGKFMKNIGGYKVYSLNFNQPELSDRINPFVNIRTEKDILRMVQSLFESCRPLKQNHAASADPFWDDAVQLLLQSLTYAVWLEARSKGVVGTMNRLVELLNWEAVKVVDPISEEVKTKLQVYMEDLRERYGDEYPPVRDYFGLKDGATETVRSVVLMLRGMLKICNTAEVKRIFEANDINIRDLGLGVDGNPDKKAVLFLGMPSIGAEYNWIMSLCYTQIFDELNHIANFEGRKGNKCPVRVEFIMDEYYTGPKPLNPLELLSVVRSWNVGMLMFLQSVAQLQDLYQGEAWNIIMDNLSVVGFLGSGPTALSTHEFISKALGEGTFFVKNENANFGQSSSSGITWSQAGRALLTPNDVKKLDPTLAIIFIKGSDPIIDTKAFPFDMPHYGYKAPKWLKEPYEKAMALGDYIHPVYTVYDAEHFHYITVRREEPLQIVTNKDDIKALKYAAVNDPSIYTYDVDEEQLLYLSWGKKNEYSEEEIQNIYRAALENAKLKKERMKGLYVLQDVENVPNFGTKLDEVDKTGWERCATLKALLSQHWEDLSAPEQEEMCLAMDEGLTEEQLRTLMLYSLSEMSKLRQVFVRENQMRG